ncbi:MAG: cell division protein SepF [Acholeplasmataceae bacterium]|nr:cell division protein SepF [Acholeplasmataceae bacterium]
MFRKRKKEAQAELPRYQDFSVQTAFDRIIFEDLVTDEDAYIVELARELLDGSPLVINFEQLGVDEANKVVAFLSGVIYACDGQVEKINSRVFLFARNQEFKDGTLKKFVEEYQE